MFQWIYRLFVNKQPLRYILSGGFTTIVGTIVLTILIYYIPYEIAYTIVFVASFIANMILQSRFVFEETLNNRFSWVLAALLLQYCLGLGGLYILIDIIDVHKAYAPFLNLCVCTPINYLISKTAFSINTQPKLEDD